MAARNLVNLKDVSKGYSSRTILDRVTLGVEAGDRIGIVGRNGDGKSTLLRLIGGDEVPDEGNVIRGGDVTAAMLSQGDPLNPDHTVREELLGERAGHEIRADAVFRSVLDGLLGGVDIRRFPDGLETKIAPLSGGERRRIALAKVLLEGSELLLLDEPTNHLDVEGVDWLAQHLRERKGSLLVVTHDRWFLDEVCENTWEVADKSVFQYEGGYAAYVLAKAERDRQEAASETRRRALIRKELAWLRRGPPARTVKAKFRVDAANELIADEPPPRNSVELLRFASKRIGSRVIDAVNVTFGFKDRLLFDHITWRLGPADRLGLVGVNGAGKSTLIKLLGGEIAPNTGSVKRGLTVHLAELSQDTAELPEQFTVIESLERARLQATLSDGKEISASQLCERFGFRGPRARTPVRDLSGGERRRLQLMCLLMEEPNVLLLDEPTNDLDIDTLNALEDLLDSWPGTLVVVSHDRYFIERVTDNVYGLLGDGQLTHLPGGIDQYVKLRRNPTAAEDGEWARQEDGPGKGKLVREAQKREKEIRKVVKRLDRELEAATKREGELHEEMVESSTDHVRLRELQTELAELKSRREQLEADWLEQSALLEE